MTRLGVAILSPGNRHRENAARLADELSSLEPMLVEGRVAWHRASLAAWTTLTELAVARRFTHLLVLEDGVKLAPCFLDDLTDILAAVPDQVIAPMYSRPGPVAKLRLRWPGFVLTTGGLWGPAICAPTAMVLAYLRWSRTWILPAFEHDDIRWQIWLLFHGLQAWAPIPSIVTTDPSLGREPYNAVAFRDDCEPIAWEAARDNTTVDRQLTLTNAGVAEVERISRTFGKPAGWSDAALGITPGYESWKTKRKAGPR